MIKKQICERDHLLISVEAADGDLASERGLSRVEALEEKGLYLGVSFEGGDTYLDELYLGVESVEEGLYLGVDSADEGRGSADGVGEGFLYLEMMSSALLDSGRVFSDS